MTRDTARRLHYRLGKDMPWLLARLVTAVSGVSLLLWAATNPVFRTDGGFPTSSICLPLSVGLALLVGSALASGSHRVFAAWLTLFIVGQAVSLQLIVAGANVHYQHYVPLESALDGPERFLLLFLAFQLAVVVAAGRGLWPIGVNWLKATLGGSRLVLGAVFLVLIAAVPSNGLIAYGQELCVALVAQLGSTASLCLAVRSLSLDSLGKMRRWLDALLSRVAPAQRSKMVIDGFAAMSATWVVVVAALLCLFAYERHPHVPDELAYLFHARYFSEGLLTMPAPPVPAAFDLDLMQMTADRWYSPVPPGWPMMLSVGAFFDAAWLVNPILGGLSVLLTYLLLQGIANRRLARLTVVLLCFSPWYLFMAMNFMTHMATLTWALVGAVSVVMVQRTGRVSWSLAVGAAIGATSLIRPLDGALVGILFGPWMLGLGGRRLSRRLAAAAAVGACAVGSIALLYNLALTDAATTFPIMAYADARAGVGSNALGFGPDRGFGWAIDAFPGHTPLEAVLNTALNLFALNVELFGWASGSLVLVTVFVLSRRTRSFDHVMLASLGAVMLGHCFYWFSGGPDFGARYWFLASVPLAALAARAVETFALSAPGTDRAPDNALRLIVAVGLLCLSTLLTFVPWRAIDKYHNYRRMQPGIQQLAADADFGRSLVLIQGNRDEDYASAAAYNPIDLSAPVPIYVWSRDDHVTEEVLAVYRDRPVWIVNGPSLTGSRYVIERGPVSAAELLVELRGR